MNYRLVRQSDIPAMVRIRADESGTEDYWRARITAYLAGELHPQKALPPRVGYVAEFGGSVIGFITGHLTRRFACHGELEWINVTPQHRRQGIATELVYWLARWFGEHQASRICVDPGNELARQFYKKLGAEALNPHWLVWNDIALVLNP